MTRSAKSQRIAPTSKEKLGLIICEMRYGGYSNVFNDKFIDRAEELAAIDDGCYDLMKTWYECVNLFERDDILYCLEKYIEEYEQKGI